MATLNRGIEPFNAEGEILQANISGSNFGRRGCQEGIGSGRAKRYTEDATEEHDRRLWRTYWDEMAVFDEDMPDASC